MLAKKAFLLFCLLIANSFSSFAKEKRFDSVDTLMLKQDIETLSSDEFQGRFPGTEGDRFVNEYLQKRFKEMGEFAYKREEFSFKKREVEPLKCKLLINGKSLLVEKEFNPLPKSSKVTEFKGRVTLSKEGYLRLSHRNPLKVYGERRDSLLIYILEDSVNFMPNFNRVRRDTLVPIVEIHKFFLDSIINLESSSKIGDSLELFFETSIGFNYGEIKSYNHIFVLSNKKDENSNEPIIISAHYDHLGVNKTRYLTSETGDKYDKDSLYIYNGADDNASGVAMVMAMANSFVDMAEKGEAIERDIIFLFLGAEEQGLVGSKAFCNKLVEDNKKIEFVINFDMLGTLHEGNYMGFLGSGTAVEFDSVFAELSNKDSMQFRFERTGNTPTDARSFYGAGIPVLGILTGNSPNYHSPKDDAENISYKGMQKVYDVVMELTLNLMGKEKLRFQIVE